MDSGDLGQGVRLVALFGRRVDPQGAWAWAAARLKSGAWSARIPGSNDVLAFASWRDDLAAVRAAEGER